jgi:uracil-DNA glycosylase
MVNLNNDWDVLLESEFKKEYYLKLREFLKEAYRTRVIYPNMYDIFNALKLTAYEQLKVVIVGQDPYINPGEAHGLAFSVQPSAKIPPSLYNIFKELETDIGCSMPQHGCLLSWAKQGVLLLNAVLTVERGKSRSHAGWGWETFTDRVLSLINAKDTPIVYLLWGRDAQTKGQFLNNSKHLVLTAAHPSPLAGGKFFGCRHFSKTNTFLENHGLTKIDWQI